MIVRVSAFAISVRLNLTLLTRLLTLFNLFEFLSAFSGTEDSYDQSIAYKLLPSREKRELQNQLLNLLGLDHRPKPKRKDLLSSVHLKDIYHTFLNSETDGLIDESSHPFFDGRDLINQPTVQAFKESDAIVSFVNDSISPNLGVFNSVILNDLEHPRDSRLWFDTHEIAPGSKVLSAELRIFKNETLTLSKTFDLYKINLHLITNDSNQYLRLIGSESFSHKPKWLIFNVTSAIQSWINDPENNFGLYMTVHSTFTGKELLPESIGLIGSKGAVDKYPFIFAFFKSQSHLLHRKKRDTKPSEDATDYKPRNAYSDLSEYVSGRSCQKKSLFVSFKELQWSDWIIAPDGYAASFCDGECSFPLTAQMNATNHAIVQTLVHSMNPNAVPKASCVPTKLSSIMVLYFDTHSNVILKKYKNMAVKSCGCY